MRLTKVFRSAILVSVAVLTVNGVTVSAQTPNGGRVITIGEGRPDLTFVGQFASTTTGSFQNGYVSRIEGISNVFNSSTIKNETTAMFTFVNDAINVQVLNNGPMRLVTRKGTTTIYYHPEGGANFADPSSFAVGIPIQVSDYDQQVMIEPAVSFPFQTTHLNTVTLTEPFTLGGELLRLGRKHDAWRTHYFAHQNVGTSPVTGYFLGYAVGVSRRDGED